MKAAKKVLDWVTKVEYAIMTIAFAIMVVAYFISVVNRNFIKMSMPWTEELAIYSMTFMALLGMEVGLRDGTQVAVTAVIEKLTPAVRRVVSVIEQLVLEAFAFVMVRSSIAMVLKQLQSGQTTPVLKIPMAAMYFSLVLAFGLVLVVQGVTLVEKVRAVIRKEDIA